MLTSSSRVFIVVPNFSAILTVPDLVRSEQFGVFDSIYNHPKKSQIKFQFITEVSHHNLDALKLLFPKLRVEISIKARNFTTSFSLLPRMIIRDKKILLIKRKNPPFKGKWALPGGFVDYNEKTEDAVVREIFEETGLKTTIKNLVGVYSDPKRDPRGHTISVVYILEIVNGKIKSGDDAADAKFFDLKQLPELSFDHDVIIKDGLRSIR